MNGQKMNFVSSAQPKRNLMKSVLLFGPCFVIKLILLNILMMIQLPEDTTRPFSLHKWAVTFYKQV